MPLGRDMHSKAEVLDRIGQIRELVASLPVDRINLNNWVTAYAGDFTVCCAAGWAANHELFGLHLDLSDCVATIVWRSDKSSEVLSGRRALIRAIFGDINNASAWWHAWEEISTLFGSARDGATDDHQTIFLRRCDELTDRLGTSTFFQE